MNMGGFLFCRNPGRTIGDNTPVPGTAGNPNKKTLVFHSVTESGNAFDKMASISTVPQGPENRKSPD